jgi:signal transduction histidine kinase/CheY-like chemotaxis protein
VNSLGPLSPLLARFAEPADRIGAAAELAQRLGVDEVLVLVRDPELGVLVPAPGFAQTLEGGPSWRAFLKTCHTPGVHVAEVDRPTAAQHARRAVAHVSSSGVGLVMLGGRADEAALACVLEALPLLGAIFRAEHDARLARGEAQVARTTSGHARNLALALDAARGDVERSLAESARLNDELKETDRRKDDFMAMLGHELRNPMAAISGAIEVMRARPDDGAQIERARGIIERQTEQLARLVDDLLDVARISRGKISLRIEPLDIEDIVRRAAETVHAAATAKRHEITIEVKARVQANGDRTRLEQMVTNLLTNAVKYTDPGGHIRVVVDRRDGRAIVEVDDDGIGISPAMLPRIFDAFLQVDPSLDRSGGGLGVGLTVVSRLAALHGGSVDAQSTAGKGSTFTLRLPAIEPGAAAPAPTADEVALSSGRVKTKKRVLVVDDNVDSAEMMVALAENWGHEAFHAVDGRGAVAMAHELRPDVVLLDIGLPGMDGYEVAARLRDDPVTQGARIIAVSGYGQDSDRLKSRAAGCDEHLVKPVDLGSLARFLRS